MGEPVRILRVVIVSALILCAVKVADIAAGGGAVAASTEETHAPDPASPLKDASAPTPPETREAAPVPDPSGSDASGVAAGRDLSRAEIEVLQNLSNRRTELDERSRELDMREKLLKASEQRVAERIGELQQIEANIQSLLKQRDAAEEAQLAGLVKVYENMKPKDAARIFDKLDMDILLPVAQRMKAQKAAQVMAEMESEAAKRLTVNLARRMDGQKAREPAAENAPAPQGG